jgi:putative membrane protein
MSVAKLLVGLLIAAAAITSCKKEDTAINNQLNEADNNFIIQVGTSNLAEIETAKAALAKTADTIVLSFARQMLTGYTRAQSDLKTMGTIVGFIIKDSLGTAPPISSQLDTLTGRTFDSTYIHTRLQDQQSMISFYADELKNGQQINVKAYANTNLQNIQMYNQRADSIAAAFY